MAYISQIVVGGTTYDIKDRSIAGAMHFVGTTTTVLTDGATTKPIKINGADYTQNQGDVVLYGGAEFVWTGTAWELLGDESSYAVKGTYDTTEVAAGGSVSQPSFTGTAATISSSGTIAAKNLNVSEVTTGSNELTWSANYTPAGTVSQPTFSGSSFNSSGTTSAFVTSATVSRPTFSGTAATHNHEITAAAPGTGETANYTPAGTVGAPSVTTKTFSGTTATIEVTTTGAVTAVSDHSYQPAGTVSKPTFSGTAATITLSTSYTPAGSVSKPGVSLDLKTASSAVVKTISQAASTSGAVASVSGEVLTIGNAITAVGAVTVGSYNNDVVVKTNTSAALSATPTFTGTAATISVSGSYTPAGSVTQPTFTGTTATITHSLTKGTVTSTGSYRPAGSINVVVAAPSFSGTAVLIKNADAELTPAGTISTPTFNPTKATTTITVSGKATGTVSQPTFSGTAATISITKRLVAALTATSVSVSGSYTPAGTVSKPTFTGTSHKHTVTI